MSFFSWLCVSGMTMMVRYPRALATSASPMPVLPAVPSTTRPPGLSSPRFSASRIIWRGARAFTHWPRVHELGLAQNGAAGRLGDAPELDQRRVADGFDDAVVDLHAVGRLLAPGT